MRCSLCELEIKGAPIYLESARAESHAGTQTGHARPDPISLCCPGCVRVWQMTHDGSPGPGGVRRRNRTASKPPAGTQRLQLQIEGLWCSSCSFGIEESLSREAGVYCPSVHTTSGRMVAYIDPALTNRDTIQNLIEKLGYGVGTEESAQRTRQKDFQELILRLGIAVFLTFNIMMIAEAIYVGPLANYLERYLPGLSSFTLAIDDTAKLVLTLVMMGLTTPVVFYCGAPILRSGLRRLRFRQMNMDTLIAVGTLAAYFYSVWALLRGSIHVYFDTAATLITLILLGRLIETFVIKRSTEAVERLRSLRPPIAHRMVDGREEDVPVADLAIGDLIRIRPGEVLPADGIVRDGRSSVSEALVTGEATPVGKFVGHKTIGGTINLDGSLTLEVTAVGAGSVLGQMIRLVEGAAAVKAPIQQKADRLAAAFVPLVLFVAALAGLAAFRAGAPGGEALMHAVATVVIACPCALGLATPLTLFQANTEAARRGILIRSGEALEAARAVDILVFDKTGTLTTGRLTVTAIEVDPGAGLGPGESAANRPITPDELLSLAASIESSSEHPLGRALVDHARENGIPLHPVTHFERLPGLGVEGEIIVPGVAMQNPQSFALISVGSAVLLKERGLSPTPHLEERLAGYRTQGATIVYVTRQNTVIGALTLQDELKPEAFEIIPQIQSLGIRVLLLSGDSAAAAQSLAQKLSLSEWIGEATPQLKITYIRKLKESGYQVGMVGDGINDAPSLMEGDLGIAIGAGSDIAVESAGVILLKNDLRDVLTTLRLSKTTTSRIGQNLFFALVYNGVGIPMAALGFVHPIVAAAAMVASSVSVISNSLRRLLPVESAKRTFTVERFADPEKVRVS